MPTQHYLKWSPERGALWVAAYREIGNVTFACDAAGITPKTFYDWMRRGEAGLDPDLTDFYFEARRARAAKASELVSAASKDKGGPQFLLERLFPAEFGQPAKTAREALQQLLEAVLPLVSPSARAEVLDALATVERQRAGVSEHGVAPEAESGPGTLDVEGELVERRRLEPGTE